MNLDNQDGSGKQSEPQLTQEGESRRQFVARLTTLTFLTAAALKLGVNPAFAGGGGGGPDPHADCGKLEDPETLRRYRDTDCTGPGPSGSANGDQDCGLSSGSGGTWKDDDCSKFGGEGADSDCAKQTGTGSEVHEDNDCSLQGAKDSDCGLKGAGPGGGTISFPDNDGVE